MDSRYEILSVPEWYGISLRHIENGQGLATHLVFVGKWDRPLEAHNFWEQATVKHLSRWALQWFLCMLDRVQGLVSRSRFGC
jgi:hypothetical protein